MSSLALALTGHSNENNGDNFGLKHFNVYIYIYIVVGHMAYHNPEGHGFDHNTIGSDNCIYSGAHSSVGHKPEDRGFKTR
jgi:hypothetical protein